VSMSDSAPTAAPILPDCQVKVPEEFLEEVRKRHKVPGRRQPRTASLLHFADPSYDPRMLQKEGYDRGCDELIQSFSKLTTDAIVTNCVVAVHLIRMHAWVEVCIPLQVPMTETNIPDLQSIWHLLHHRYGQGLREFGLEARPMIAVRMWVPKACNSPGTSLLFEDAVEFPYGYKHAMSSTTEAAAEEKYAEFHRNLYLAGEECARQLLDTYHAKVRSRKIKIKTDPFKYATLPEIQRQTADVWGHVSLYFDCPMPDKTGLADAMQAVKVERESHFGVTW
jgi:hypothetical protein